MLRYYQVGEKGQWKPIEDGPDFFSRLEKAGGTRYSILGLNKEVAGDENDETIEYFGPWYADIDNADLSTSIDSTRELVRKLRDFDVPKEAIEVFASGGKGFHVIVNEKAIRDRPNRGLKGLPYIYRELAKGLFVIGMDFQVYSGGKGRLFRPENALRPDGNYRVRITLEELYSMAPADYKQLVSSPREIPKWTYKGSQAVSLSLRFKEAQKAIKAKTEVQTNTVEQKDLQPFTETPPACIEMVCDGKVKEQQSNFNQIAMNLGIFISRAGCQPAVANTLIDRAAKSIDSGSYPTVQKKREHLLMQTSYMRSTQKYEFSCAAMRKIVGGAPCQGCPLQAVSKVNGVEPDATLRTAILLQDTGYMATDEEGLPTRAISNFTFTPVECYFEEDANTSTTSRMGTKMSVRVEGLDIGDRIVPETAFRSRSELIKTFEGISNATFVGTDTDVQRMKQFVFASSDNLDQIMYSNVVGIVINTVRQKHRVMTYVEPGWSISQYQMQDTHQTLGKVEGSPCLKHVEDIVENEKPEISDVLFSLMEVNNPKTVAHLLAWHGACHLKAHIMADYIQFPLLNMWGVRGSGKTATSLLFCLLNGVRYGGENMDPVVVTLSTKFPIVKVAATTTTIPRIFEEFNKSKFSVHSMFSFVTEILKSAWNGMSVPRGMLSSGKQQGQIGADVASLKTTSPLIYCSEQIPEVPALQERTVSVCMAVRGKAGRDKHYKVATEGQDLILKAAKFLTLRALRTPTSWTKEKIEEYLEKIPYGLPDRPKFAYACLYVGLEFLKNQLVDHLGLEELREKFEELKAALDSELDQHKEEIIMTKSRTEMDIFITTLGEMAQAYYSGGHWRDNGLQQNVHYATIDGRLHIDIHMVIFLYKRWMRDLSEPPIYIKAEQVYRDLENEDYFISYQGQHPDGRTPRSVCMLDMEKLKAKGVEPSYFYGQ
jgi:hypothetical protein